MHVLTSAESDFGSRFRLTGCRRWSAAPWRKRPPRTAGRTSGGWTSAAQAKELADLRAEQWADRGDQVRAAPFGGDPGDSVAGLRVGERDPLQDSVQNRAALTGHRRWHENNVTRTTRAGDRRPESHIAYPEVGSWCGHGMVAVTDVA